MIDLQTYRARIGGALAIINKILQRKGMVFKLLHCKTGHHEDEDLLRKALQRATISKRNQSYLLIIFLVTMFNVLKYLLNESHLVSWTGHYCVNWTLLQKLFVQCCWTLSHVPYSLFQSLCSDSWELVYENCDTYLKEVAMTVYAVGLCLSSIGAVHFISILLLIAGIEPNPGPNILKGSQSKNISPFEFFELTPKHRQGLFEWMKSGRSQNTVPIASTQVAIKGIVQYSTRSSIGAVSD